MSCYAVCHTMPHVMSWPPLPPDLYTTALRLCFVSSTSARVGARATGVGPPSAQGSGSIAASATGRSASTGFSWERQRDSSDSASRTRWNAVPLRENPAVHGSLCLPHGMAPQRVEHARGSVPQEARRVTFAGSARPENVRDSRRLLEIETVRTRLWGTGVECP